MKISVHVRALLKETAFRPVEASRLTPMDFDIERRTVTLNDPAKRSRPRQAKISPKLINMLNPLILRIDPNQRLWTSKLDHMSETIRRHRDKVANRLGNPNLKRITLKTFRHWKATQLYHQTKDILYVMQFLGHKSIKNTLKYVQIEGALFQEENEGVICKVASNVDEAKTLIEAGFDYVCELNDVKLFRRRK